MKKNKIKILTIFDNKPSLTIRTKIKEFFYNK